MHDETVNKVKQSFGAALKKRREDLRMTRVAVESLAGIESNYLSQIENGIRTPSLSALIRIANAVEMDLVIVEREGKVVPEWLQSQIYKKRK
jgi:transcriptional regulator with XRE-family HTH domain